MNRISRRECLKLTAVPLLGNLMGATGSQAAEDNTKEKEDRTRSKRARLPAERTSYTDAETGRKVTLWTAPGAGHNVGFYYHQNPFDAKRNLVYFVSDRTGSWQLWRAHLGDGRLEQVSEFEGLGRIRRGADVNQHGANYFVYVSPRSGQVYLGGESRIAAINADTFDCRVLWKARIADDDRTTRFISQSYVFPSCDERWVYSYGVFASRDEMAAAQALSKAAFAGMKAEGRRVHAQYAEALHGMTESPLEQVIFRVEVATGRVEQLWRGHWWLQHVMASPTDPDLVSFLWAALMRPKPKYFLMRAGEEPRCVERDEMNYWVFHDFWHPDGTRWYMHRCENMHPCREIFEPLPGKLRYTVREVDIARFLATGEVKSRDWYESSGEAQMHSHVNIAPDGSFLAGDGEPRQGPYICRLDWREDGTIPATRLCRTEYTPPGGVGGMETNPNVHVAPHGKSVFFTTWRDGKACLASVET